MVDGDRIGERLDRLHDLVGLLDEVRAGGEEAYLADQTLRAATERRLQMAIQICIDVGAQLGSELSLPTAHDYAGVFTALAGAGHVPRELADRLVEAAKQRNLLVHVYLDVDDRKVFAALDRLDDLREFAQVAQLLADER